MRPVPTKEVYLHSHCFQMLMVSLATDSIHASRVRIYFRFASYWSVFGAVGLRKALSLES